MILKLHRNMGLKILLLLWMVVLLHKSNAELIDGNIGQNYSYTVANNETLTVKYDLAKLNESHPARVHVNKVSSAINDLVFVVVRQGRDVVSWELPEWTESGQTYNFVGRTVCPYMTDSLYVIISSPNQNGVAVNMRVDLQSQYLLLPDTPIKTSATPTQPRYFRFEFPPKTTVVFVEAISPNTSCATLFLFKSCSVHKLIERSYSKESYRQTITKSGGMMVHRKYFPKGHFYVGFLVYANDDKCLDDNHHTPINGTPISYPVRIKNITLTIHDISDVETIASVMEIVGFFTIFIFVLIICWAAVVLWMKCKKRLGGENAAVELEYNTLLEGSDACENQATINRISREIDNLSLEPNAPEHEPPEAQRCPNCPPEERQHSAPAENIPRRRDIMILKFMKGRDITVNDLCWHDLDELRSSTQLFAWILAVVMIYNGLPVIYMMLVYQMDIHKTGDMDWCYYNFFCAHPMMFFSDFNHIISNFGYVFLGIIFNAIVYREERNYIKRNPESESEYGIPAQFGLYYAMGWALFAEGVCSACYHVCPNRFNFQIDTCFMFVIAVLCLLALYQKRHPSITLRPKYAFIFLALLFITSWIGELFDDSIYCWLGFSLMHMIVTFLCAYNMYYFDHGKILSPRKTLIFYDWMKPKYPWRFVFLILFVGLNIGCCIYGLVKQPEGFATYILGILIANLIYGTLLYIVLKCCHGEGVIRPVPCILLLLSIGCWATAFTFFGMKATAWERNPAISRTYNRPCIFGGYFDSHDIWHIFSSLGLFTYYCVLLTIDKHLYDVPRIGISVLF